MNDQERPVVVRLMPVLDFGGVESRVVTLAGLVDSARFDYRVCTFAKAGDAAGKLRAQGITVDDLGVPPAIPSPRTTAALVRYLRAVNAEVVHASILEANFHAGLVRTVPGAPSVVVEEVGVPERNLAARVVFGAAYRQADVIVGVSRATCRFLIEQHRLPEAKVRLVYNTLHPRFFVPIEPPPASPTFRVLTFGRLVEVKNQSTLIAAVGALASSGMDVVLTIAGDGPLGGALRAQADGLGLGERVKFPGFCTDVRPLLLANDVFVLPSFNEGTSISLLEAMTTGRPVVGSTAAGIAEALEGYGDEWLVDPRDTAGLTATLQRLAAASPERRAELGLRARELVEQRASPAAYQRAVNGLYEEMVQLRRQRSAHLFSGAARRWLWK